MISRYSLGFNFSITLSPLHISDAVAMAHACMPLMWLRLIRQLGIVTEIPPVSKGFTLNPCGLLKGTIQFNPMFMYHRVKPLVRDLESMLDRSMWSVE